MLAISSERMSPAMDNQTKINIFWLRRDLRLHDNTGFYHALQDNFPVLPVFIFDANITDQLEDKDDPRVEFIYNTLAEIQKTLRHTGSSMLVRRGEPLKIWQKLVYDFNINAVYTNHDYEPYAIGRDENIKKLLEEFGISFNTFKDQVIFEKNEVMKDDGKPYTVYTPYRIKWSKLLQAKGVLPFPSQEYLHKLIKTEPFSMPSLSDIGFHSSGYTFPDNLLSETIVQNYDKRRDYPGIDGTTRLSLHLRFGTCSIRNLVQKALELNETWLSELVWREFFMMILYNFPYVVDQPFKKKYDKMSWRNDKQDFQRWCDGQTGFPIVDAGMRELNQTGFMHNRVRMITASFLTKHLLIDWRWGERYFARKLLDYELSSNNGNWQWAAGCGCDAAPYFRIFNPATQTKKFDSDLVYIKKWVPEFNSQKYPKPIVDHTFARERALSTYSLIQ
jgi:deoxyribodipyrimidine photo-lyase